jgi:hypothetical protein
MKTKLTRLLGALALLALSTLNSMPRRNRVKAGQRLALRPAHFAITLALLSTLNSPLSTALAQGTAFTYQGRLNSGGTVAGGSYDVKFTLYATNQTGLALAGPVTNTAVGVTNGLFTTIVAFGPGVFTGGSNWLEIAVSTNAANAFSTLAPRQQLTPVPYAITAENVSGTVAASSISGTILLAQLPAGLVTNNEAGLNLTGSFTGNGANVTNVNAVALNGLNATNFWQTSGNAGTRAGNNYLGTADNQPVELHVNGGRALRLEPGGASALVGSGIPTGAPNVMGGSPVNFVAAGVVGAVIAGGGATNYNGLASTNSVSADLSFLGGGSGNSIQFSAIDSVLGGGAANSIQTNAQTSFLGGGTGNAIQLNASASVLVGGAGNSIHPNALYAFLGGGDGNINGGISAVIGGGFINSITSGGNYSVIGGGSQNSAGGIGSFIGGGGFDGTTYSGNANSGNATVIGGGLGNLIASGGNNSVIGGGTQNTIQASATNSMIGGGGGNLIASGGKYSVIGGGSQNSVGGIGSFIGGGGYDGTSFSGNNIYGNAAVIGGGWGNSIQSGADYSFLGGGLVNSISGGGKLRSRRRQPEFHY